MTRISFYILQSDSAEAKLGFSCQLVDKAMRQGNKVMVHTAHEGETKEIDDLLWRFKPESYLPHAAVSANETDSPVQNDQPILISHNDSLSAHHDVMVNLANTVPANFARYTRFAQIVNQESECLKASRQLFAFFKERGYPIEVNKLKR